MSKKTVRARDKARDDVEEAQRREGRQRARRAAVARYKVERRVQALYRDAALGRPV